MAAHMPLTVRHSWDAAYGRWSSSMRAGVQLLSLWTNPSGRKGRGWTWTPQIYPIFLGLPWLRSLSIC